MGALRQLTARGDATSTPFAVKKIGEQLERAQVIIRRLRDFLRSGQAVMKDENLCDALDEAIDLLKIASRARELVVHTLCQPGLPPVRIDRIQIQQVLFNLMRNAVEAMQDQPQPVLTAAISQLEGAMVEVSVTDCGTGLPERMQQNLFKPFFTTMAASSGRRPIPQAARCSSSHWCVRRALILAHRYDLDRRFVEILVV